MQEGRWFSSVNTIEYVLFWERGQRPEEDPFKVGRGSKEEGNKSVEGSSRSACLARGGPEKKKIPVLNNIDM